MLMTRMLRLAEVWELVRKPSNAVPGVSLGDVSAEYHLAGYPLVMLDATLTTTSLPSAGGSNLSGGSMPQYQQVSGGACSLTLYMEETPGKVAAGASGVRLAFARKTSGAAT